MKIIIKQRDKIRINKFFEWLIYMFGYTLVLISVSVWVKSLYIDTFLYGLIAAIIIYILNKTIKPIIVLLTLPITGITLGLFYPFINVFILNIVEFILKGHFQINGIISAFFVAILISVMNILMEHIVIKPLLEKGKSHESNRH
ncbi:MAG: phage holin family protein [Bacilli bacterium]